MNRNMLRGARIKLRNYFCCVKTDAARCQAVEGRDLDVSLCQKPSSYDHLEQLYTSSCDPVCEHIVDFSLDYNALSISANLEQRPCKGSADLLRKSHGSSQVFRVALALQE